MNFSAFWPCPRVESTVLRSNSGSSTSREVLFTEPSLLVLNGAVPYNLSLEDPAWKQAGIRVAGLEAVQLEETREEALSNPVGAAGKDPRAETRRKTTGMLRAVRVQSRPG